MLFQIMFQSHYYSHRPSLMFFILWLNSSNEFVLEVGGGGAIFGFGYPYGLSGVP